MRPEHLSAAAADATQVPATFTVEFAEQMGAESIIYLKGSGRSLIARVYGEHLYQPGETFTTHIQLEKAHLFDPATENRLVEGS